jgi:hypothetical protein
MAVRSAALMVEQMVDSSAVQSAVHWADEKAVQTAEKKAAQTAVLKVDQ